jgi:hypothetical protein
MKIVETREGASPGSSWQDRLCLCLGDTKRYRLFIGGYAGLANACDYFNEDTNEYDLPSHIDGVEVVGIEDDVVVGGELTWIEEDETVEFDAVTEPQVAAWLKQFEWTSETVAAMLVRLESRPVGKTGLS